MRAFHPEDIARSAIDARLVACGWLVQSRDEMNLSAGIGVAVREFATGSGPVDYALFVDKRFCGVVEAKPAGTTLSGFSEQAARYIADAPDFVGGDLRQRRFEYVASDTETLSRDLADPEPRSRRVFTFHRPENSSVIPVRAGVVRIASSRRLPPFSVGAFDVKHFRLSSVDRIYGCRSQGSRFSSGSALSALP